MEGKEYSKNLYLFQERTNAIEAIESKLNVILLGDKRVDFLPYATTFLGFMLQYIPDINFKISLTTIKIICKPTIEIINLDLQLNFYR